MPGSVEELPAVGVEGHIASGHSAADHPMRVMTRRAAGLHPGGWDAEARATVSALFDGLAGEWHTRISPERIAVVVDALDRGLPDPPGRTDVCVEVGSGIGAYTEALARRWSRVLAVELSIEMLRLAPPDPGHRLLADAAVLPLADGVADAVVLVNSFLFPHEVGRVLAAHGAVIWVNSIGDQTPIHLSSGEVAASLPGDWQGVGSQAGEGTWCVLRRRLR